VVVNKIGVPVDFIADIPKNGPNETETTQLVTVFASVIAVAAQRRPGVPGGPPLHKL